MTTACHQHHHHHPKGVSSEREGARHRTFGPHPHPHPRTHVQPHPHPRPRPHSEPALTLASTPTVSLTQVRLLLGLPRNLREDDGSKRAFERIFTDLAGAEDAASISETDFVRYFTSAKGAAALAAASAPPSWLRAAERFPLSIDGEAAVRSQHGYERLQEEAPPPPPPSLTLALPHPRPHPHLHQVRALSGGRAL